MTGTDYLRESYNDLTNSSRSLKGVVLDNFQRHRGYLICQVPIGRLPEVSVAQGISIIRAASLPNGRCHVLVICEIPWHLPCLPNCTATYGTIIQ